MKRIEIQVSHFNRVSNELMAEEENGGCQPFPVPLLITSVPATLHQTIGRVLLGSTVSKAGL